MRNNEESEPDVLFKSSHILKGEILSKIIDHVQQPILGEFLSQKRHYEVHY